MNKGKLLNLMAARRVSSGSADEQEPWEYTNVRDVDQLVVHIYTLYYDDGTPTTVNFKTGMYRRPDKMASMLDGSGVSLDTDNNIETVVLGRDGDQISGVQLGDWLCVEWNPNNDCVFENKAIAR